MSERYGVLWDLDNTLLPSKDMTARIFDVILPEFGVRTPTKDEIHQAFGLRLEDFLHTLTGGHDDQPGIINRFLEEQNSQYEEDILLFEGVLETIAELGEMGVHQAVVTSRGNHNGALSGALSIVERSGLGEYIDTVVTVDDTKMHKPHPAPIYCAMNKLWVKPDRTIMVGDQKNDVEAAKRARIRSVGLVHDDFPDALRLGTELVDHGATTVCYRAESVVRYARSTFGL